MDRKGVLPGTDVLTDGGRIAAIGTGLSAQGAEVIDATGRYVLPGFVDAHSHVGGFSTTGSEDEDLNEITNPVTAELDAYYGIDPKSAAFPHIAKFGITTSCVTPGSANVICGWALAIKSAGDSLDSRVIKDPVALKAAMGINPKGCYIGKNMMPSSRMGIAEVMREYFMKVKEYMEAKDKAKGDAKKMPKYDLAMEHGIPVLQRKIPLKVHSYQHDMMTVLRIADEFGFDVTLDHALGASDFYDELSSSKHLRGLIYGPVGSPVLPGELCKIDFECLAELDRRGVLTACMTDGPITNCHVLVDEAGEAVRHGMDPMRALAMITINAARIIMCDRRVGSLKVGKDADMLIYTGLPTRDAAARNLATIIDGKVVWQA